jgi:signal recognition particle subunit SRP9
MFIPSWDEFAKQAERLYLNNPLNCRLCLKYRNEMLILRLTDNHTCLQYKTKYAQDVKKAEKFMSSLLRHMASKET